MCLLGMPGAFAAASADTRLLKCAAAAVAAAPSSPAAQPLLHPALVLP